MMDLNSTKVFVVYKVYLKIENKNEAISEFIRSVCVIVFEEGKNANKFNT